MSIIIKNLWQIMIQVILLLTIPIFLLSKTIETFYGDIEVEEPILLELIENPSFQRLKKIHQYGISYYTTHKEEYTRYDHSMGVFALLRVNGRSIKEQVAGLLHDVSHTAFSHVGDWVFNQENQEIDYQNGIHSSFLKKTGLSTVLEKYGFTVEEILPEESLFPALENKLPHLCADRIDYNIQGAYHQGFITHQEAISIFQDIHFIDNEWVSTLPELMKKLSLFSIFMTKDCWSHPRNYVSSKCLASAILKAIDIQLITMEDFQYGIDQQIWEKLTTSKDPMIQKNISVAINPDPYFCLVDSPDEATWVVKNKFRGINPKIHLGSICAFMNEIDEEFSSYYILNKNLTEQEVYIKYFE